MEKDQKREFRQPDGSGDTRFRDDPALFSCEMIN
jgi:hypothetical protein